MGLGYNKKADYSRRKILAVSQVSWILHVL